MSNDDKSMGKQEDVQALFGEFVPGQQDSTENPMMRAKEMMKTELPKRFYKEVSVGIDDEGGAKLYRVLLDGRPIRSPAKKIIAVPVEAIAQGLAEEWSDQTKEINPATMPLTRLINSTIDGVEDARGAMLDEIVAYLNNDFICYPASHPERLVANQKDHWKPILDWAEGALGGRFVQASGILAVEQSPVMGQCLREKWQGLDIYQLGAVHSVMTITGSSLLSFALWDGFLDAEAVWSAAMVDEMWNVEMWGEDELATQSRDYRRRDYLSAALVIDSFRA